MFSEFARLDTARTLQIGPIVSNARLDVHELRAIFAAIREIAQRTTSSAAGVEPRRIVPAPPARVRSTRAPSNELGAQLQAGLAALRTLVEEMRTAPDTAPTAATAPETPAADLVLTAPSTARIVMLVGPSGAGKTTTVAKLAARAAVIERRRVSLISVDNHRMGALDQMRMFAQLIDVPMQIATSAGELCAAIDDRAELTLIDTIGRTSRDASSIAELADQLRQLPPVEVHVVVPAPTSTAAVYDLLGIYARLAPARLLFTKLDEVASAEQLVRVPIHTRLPVTWVTTGQAVPDDLEQPTPQRLRELATHGVTPSTTSSNPRGRAA